MTFIFYDILEGSTKLQIPVNNPTPMRILEALTFKELIAVNTRLHNICHRMVGGMYMYILSNLSITAIFAAQILTHVY